MTCRAGLLPALALLVACQPESAKSDHTLPWLSHAEWSVGGALDGQISLSTLQPFQIAADSAGRIFVLDQPTAHIFVLSPEGQVVDTIGGHGAGPGELVDPWALVPMPAGGIAAVDLGSRRLVRWDADLKPRPPISLPAGIDHPRVAAIGDELVFTVSGVNAAGDREYRLMASDSGRETVISRLARPPLRIVDLPACGGRQISVVPLFTPQLHWDHLGPRLAVSAGPTYDIQLYDRGLQSQVVQRPLLPKRATPSLAEAEARDWRFNGCLEPPAEVVAKVGYLEMVPLIEALLLSPAVELWVRRRARGRDARATDVFGPDGRYLGTLDSSMPFPAAFLDPDRMLAIVPDTDDVPALTLYRLTRSQ